MRFCVQSRPPVHELRTVHTGCHAACKGVFVLREGQTWPIGWTLHSHSESSCNTTASRVGMPIICGLSDSLLDHGHRRIGHPSANERERASQEAPPTFHSEQSFKAYCIYRSTGELRCPADGCRCCCSTTLADLLRAWEYIC